MKTPEEIKKGLEFCPGQYSASCGKCPYSNDGRDCGRNGAQIMIDALAYIQQLEATVSEKEKVIAELLEKFEQLQEERDELLSDLKNYGCYTCEYYECEDNEMPCANCQAFSLWERMGACLKNTEVQEDA